MKTVLILGATGAVGRHLLAQALQHPDIARVIAPTRRALPAHAKLENPIVDFESLPLDAPWWHVDAALCALGTTLKTAGSAAAFRRVDYDYILNAAQRLRAAGTPCLVLNSTMGANASARGLYLKTKGETERDVMALGFASLTIVRPSLLNAGKRPEQRLAEDIGLCLDRYLGRWIPLKWRAIEVEKVAQNMLKAALAAKPGVSWLESAELHSEK
ncbi:NAD(P)H-binding protein [Deefgea tanakiae]|uniref:NAD(P)H-binding protein n=1 Tax=Deefgea tanakiae TaxID=2865840 RepID=A0ABX8Z804_9NEIS|nr:NAD(P)H-binding protein [Deefgea tanakiae]QZA78714.1 NAD(P)H-binding protein [Deefgea tanakiae]